MSNPDDIVGHKTFSTGERDKHGMPIHRHEPLTRREADALWQQAEEAKKRRTDQMPDEKSAINAMWQAYQRLKELGWREAMYCPKDGSEFHAIEAGSTGIHVCSYSGKWPNGMYLIFDEGDCWPSHPILYRALAGGKP